jgi:hypothetical protein
MVSGDVDGLGMLQDSSRKRYGPAMADVVDALRKLALTLPEVEESIACAGTAIEQSSFRTHGKAFLFAQRKGDVAVVRMKLDASLAKANDAVGVEVGKGGWVTCRLPLGKAPSAAVKRWARESHALFASAPKSASKTRLAEKRQLPKTKPARTTATQRFTAKLESEAHGGHFVVVPAKKAEAAGLKHGARVRGTFDGVPFRSAIMKYSGAFHLHLRSRNGVYSGGNESQFPSLSHRRVRRGARRLLRRPSLDQRALFQLSVFQLRPWRSPGCH